MNTKNQQTNGKPELKHVVKSFLLQFTVESGSHVCLCEENLETQAAEHSVEHGQHEQQLLHKPVAERRHTYPGTWVLRGVHEYERHLYCSVSTAWGEGGKGSNIV